MYSSIISITAGGFAPRPPFPLWFPGEIFPLSWIEENFFLYFPWEKFLLCPGIEENFSYVFLGKNFPLSGHRIIFLRFHSEKHFPLSWVEENFPYAFLGKFFSSILNKGKFTNVFLGKKVLLYFGQWKILVIFWLGKFSTILNRRKFPSCFPWENFPLSRIEENVFPRKVRRKFFLPGIKENFVPRKP